MATSPFHHIRQYGSVPVGLLSQLNPNKSSDDPFLKGLNRSLLTAYRNELEDLKNARSNYFKASKALALLRQSLQDLQEKVKELEWQIDELLDSESNEKSKKLLQQLNKELARTNKRLTKDEQKYKRTLRAQESACIARQRRIFVRQEIRRLTSN